MSITAELHNSAKSTINPYRIGASVIFNRLKYDLSPYSLRNFYKLKNLRDKYLGQKCVILCNGPSLNNVDFDALDESGIFTIGLNKINLLFNRVNHRPKLIVSVNQHVIEQNFDFFSKTDIPIFLDYITTKTSGVDMSVLKSRQNLHFLNSVHVLGEFAKDVSLGVCQGYTVTYVATQLAYHLGFTKVALVGCDHNFETKGMVNKEIKLNGHDPNHFDPNYFSQKDKWQLPDLLGSEFHYQLARDEYVNSGRTIYNCTDGGKLELFERLNLLDFLKL
ncbi:6-hydroxymethylpterin diphosphokinase MptE-like protein [Spirosoma flavum]|uniref:6-hydroxymethylpterin diphosphokinase MptE-like protein n=1 Tax=Spirosoma flavum TaxID=2048557 RepID=A0ABW6AQR1_9BACT